MKLGKGITIESALTFPTGTKKHLEDWFSLHPVEAFLSGHLFKAWISSVFL
jgi:hypothetical protein